MTDQNSVYEIGYGRPPRANQFSKGVSGNPKGRPKGRKNLSQIVLKESQKKVQIDSPRGRQSLTMLEVVVKQVLQKAAKGELRASRDFIVLVQQSEEIVGSVASAVSIAELDQTVLKNLQRRMAEITPKEDSK